MAVNEKMKRNTLGRSKKDKPRIIPPGANTITQAIRQPYGCYRPVHEPFCHCTAVKSTFSEGRHKEVYSGEAYASAGWKDEMTVEL